MKVNNLQNAEKTEVTAKSQVDFLIGINSLTVKLNKIYSSRVDFRTKNDIICSNIVHTFKEVASATILIYNSRTDSLQNVGHYFHPQRGMGIEYNTTRFGNIIHNKTVLDYLFYSFYNNTPNKLNYEDYIDFTYNKHRKNKPLIDQSEFENLQTNLRQNEFEKFFSEYRKYRKFLSENDNYQISDTKSTTAKFFIKVINEETKYQFTSSNDIQKRIKKLYSTIDVEVDSNLSYLAIPLKHQGNCIGILRILLQLKEEDEEKIKSLIDFILHLHGSELYGLVEQLSILLGSQYSNFEYSYKKLPKQVIIDANSTKDISNIYGDFCQALSNRINSRACILRYGTNVNDNNFIKGWTGNINSYIQSISKQDPVAIGSELFYDLLKDINIESASDIAGLTIQINDQNNIIIKIAYIDKSHNIILKNHDDTQGNITAIYTNLYSTLKTIDVGNVLILKIPWIDDTYSRQKGFITFGNTRFKIFTLSDIETIYPHVNRLGSELLTIENAKREEHLKNIEEQKTNSSYITHDISNRLRQIGDSISKFKKKQFEILDKISGTSLGDSNIHGEILDGQVKLENIINQISNVRTIAVLYDAQIDKAATSSTSYLLGRELEKIIKAKIPYPLYPIKYFLQDDIIVNYNLSILKKIVNELLENAIKYSYTYEERAMYDQKTFKPNDYYAVLFSLKSRNNEVILEISSWGKELIGERRSDDAIIQLEQNLAKYDNSGKGLAYVRQYCEIIQGKFELIGKLKQTIASITWKQPIL